MRQDVDRDKWMFFQRCSLSHYFNVFAAQLSEVLDADDRCGIRVGNRATCLRLSPSDSDRQNTSPPSMHSTDPAQPMKRAAPSSNLQETHRCDFTLSDLPSQRRVNPEHLLLGHEEGIEEVACDPVSVDGAGRHGAQAYGGEKTGSTSSWA